MSNIRIIKTGINVSKIMKQLREHPTDWGSQRNIKDVKSLIDRGFADLPIDALQLMIGVVEKAEDFVGDSQMSRKTAAYDHHTEVVRFMKRNFHKHDRCGFLSLPVGGHVGLHIDEGTYYHTRDRYHLSIQGRYRYYCGDEHVDVEPGTLLWFNNKLMHGTENIGDCTRITFVFDVPHSKKNP
jgi:mannose-6-phosphate isomerase-like protein (cupin superfamily)